MLTQLSLIFLLLGSTIAAPISLVERTWMSYANIDPQADSGARALLRFVQGQFGWHTLSGQQENGEVNWIKSNVGKAVAIQGNDFIDYSPSRVEHGASSTEVENAMAFNNEGGINAFVWHWNAPTCLYNTPSEQWWSGFYTAATCFDVQEALNEGPGGSNYQLLLRDIDAISVEMKRLSDAGIPVLFRPLHEPDGAWFWWGAKGPGPFKQLWDLLYQRMTEYHGLHNMVWVCNTMNPAWYPGNDKCDIATTDVYNNAGDHSPNNNQWGELYGLTGGQRVLALAEVGEIPDPDQMFSSGAVWAYWMTWSGSFIEGGSDNPSSYVSSVLSNTKVATVNGPTQLGNWKSS